MCARPSSLRLRGRVQQLHGGLRHPDSSAEGNGHGNPYGNCDSNCHSDRDRCAYCDCHGHCDTYSNANSSPDRSVNQQHASKQGNTAEYIEIGIELRKLDNGNRRPWRHLVPYGAVPWSGTFREHAILPPNLRSSRCASIAERPPSISALSLASLIANSITP